jgi:hypothetical protein
MNDTISELIVERKGTHGDFSFNAKISQELKEVMTCHGSRALDPIYAEVLDMIALKISRILSGKPDFDDHWADIVGYARLAETHAKEKTRK